MHPAFLKLLKFHAVSRLRRIRESLTSPRRLTLTLLSIVLGLIWLGNTIASVVYRDPYAPDTLHRWVSLIVMVYFGWHIVRVTFRRPDEPIEWSPAERELIAGGPFSRAQQVGYRMLVILTATLPKAALTTFVLFPDLCWISPFGIVLGLVFLECCRLMFDVVACNLRQSQYTMLRVIVSSVLIAIAGLAFVTAMSTTGMRPLHRMDDGLRLLFDWASAANSIRETTIGQMMEAPFAVIADLVTGQQTTSILCIELLAVSSVIAILFFAARSFYERHFHAASVYQTQVQHQQQENTKTNRLPWIPHWGICSPLIWRQLKCVGRNRGSVIVSLAIPAVLASMPLMVDGDATVSFLSVVASIVFYSFVLLPEALKFDFRRDCDFLMKLKTLPARPRDVVFAQLSTPIVLATLFQTCVLLFAGIYRGVAIDILLGSLAFVVPATILFVALDNMVFLLYPHRAGQEGFEIFVRTILKFTFKSVLLVVALVGIVLWAPLADWLGQAIIPGIETRVVFAVGVCCMVATAAMLAIGGVVKAYDRFDVSLDG